MGIDVNLPCPPSTGEDVQFPICLSVCRAWMRSGNYTGDGDRKIDIQAFSELTGISRLDCVSELGFGSENSIMGFASLLSDSFSAKVRI